MRLQALISNTVNGVQRLSDILGIAGGFLVILMMLLVVYETVMRYTGHPVSWAYELPALVLVACVSLGLAFTTKIGGHVKLDLASSRLSRRRRGLLETATSGVAFAISAVLAWQGWSLTQAAIQQGWHTSTTVPIIQWPFFVFMVVGLVFMCLEWLIRTVSAWREFMGAQERKSEEAPSGDAL